MISTLCEKTKFQLQSLKLFATNLVFLQVSASNDKFMIQLELPGFLPEDFSLKTKDDIIVLEALHQAKSDGDSETTSR